MCVTATGQATLPFPPPLRVKADPLPGSDVGCVEEKGEPCLRKALGPDPGGALAGRMAGEGGVPRSTDDIPALTRGVPVMATMTGALRAGFSRRLLFLVFGACIFVSPSSFALELTFPRDGDVVTRHDGAETAEGLALSVWGTAPAGAAVRVNGVAAARDGGAFSCAVPVTARRARIVAEADGARAEARILWNRGSFRRYRFSVDDNIQFLKDLGTDPAAYPSLFDHWYLAFWREMHATYGAKIHLNIYYQTDGFDLTQMPDTWRDEWRANADWLRLTFHALQDKPDRPYRNAGYAQIAHDYDLVTGHIRRFTGQDTPGCTTTVHWAECPAAGVRALRDRGIENLIGIFRVNNGVCTTGYYLPPEQCARVDTRPAWHDHATGVTLLPCALVVNSPPVEEIVPLLEQRAASPHTSELVELLIHEQYFREELDLYQPTIRDKVRTALKWVTEHGHRPVFWSDGFLGVPEP